MPRVQVLKYHTLNGEEHQPDTSYEVTEAQAQNLIAQRLAREEEGTAPPESEPPPPEPEPVA